MQQNFWKACLSLALLGAALWLSVPAASAAFEMKGQDKAGKNCERQDSKFSSTFGKCENVCKDKEIVRDAPNNKWVCQGGKAASTNTTTPRPPKGGVIVQDAPPRAGSGRPSKVRPTQP